MLKIPKDAVLRCRHCQAEMYRLKREVGFGKIYLPDDQWTYAEQLSVHAVEPIPPQTIGETFHDCVNCGAHDFGV